MERGSWLVCGLAEALTGMVKRFHDVYLISGNVYMVNRSEGNSGEKGAVIKTGISRASTAAPAA